MSIAQQSWSAETYAANAGFVSDYGGDVLSWLAPRAGERVLDLGCGDGTLAERMKGDGVDVVGVDYAPSLVEAALQRGIDARLMDGQALEFEDEFDAVFSNAVLHWMTDAEAVIAGVHRALKPGGRFVAEFGGHGNVAAIVTALRALADRYGIDDRLAMPWFFPTQERYAALLTAGGFEVERMALTPRPTPLPSGLAGWIETFRAPFFQAAGSRADRVLTELEALLSPSLRDDEGRWTADYVRLRFVAHAV